MKQSTNADPTTPLPARVAWLTRLAALGLLGLCCLRLPSAALASGCDTVTLTMTGSTSTDGTDGNIRTFVSGSLSVKASAFSRTKGTSGTWAAGYLGAYSHGLGVTDTGESGSDPSHTVDNNSRLNYVLFEFSTSVIVDKAYLGYISGDSDLTAWIGTFDDPYNNHLTLSDAVLSSCSTTESILGGSSERWADLNAGEVEGNVLVIAARTTDSSDYFKIKQLTVCVPTAPAHDYGDLPVAGTTFNTDGVGRTTVIVDATSQGTTGAGTTSSSLTISHTTGAWANRLMVVGVAVGDTSNFQYNVSDVTYGGEPLTFVGRVIAPTGGGGPGGGTGYSRPQTEIWALANPASGTEDIVITLTGARAFNAGVTTFTGVDVSNGLTSALGTYASAAANSGNAASATVSTAAGQLVYDVVASANISTSGNDPGTFTPGTGQVQKWTQYSRNATSPYLRIRGAGSTALASGSSLTVTETSTTSYPWAISAVPINGALEYTVSDNSGVSGPALLNAWIDWNASGTFEPNEQIALDVNPANRNGVNTLNLNVPFTAVIETPLGARFRFSTQSGLAPTGASTNGEVEDYLVRVTNPPTAAGLDYFRATVQGGVVALH